MEISFEKIKIFIDTNIPGLNKPIALTKKLLLKGEGTTDEYPFFTGSYELQKDVLIRKSFNDRVKYCFDEETFKDSFKGKKMAKPDTYLNYNIDIMIKLLFTTVYPFINDNSNSFDTLINGTQNLNISLKGSLPNSLKKWFRHLILIFLI